MKILAVIPARGGSKGIKNKNLKYVGKKKLLEIAICEAKKVKKINKLIVSTDSIKIANEANKHGAEIPFLRPKKLASDNSLSVDVIIHAINYFKKKDKTEFDYVIMLQPTAPFRKSVHIKKAIDILIKNKNFDSLVSVVDVEGIHPYRMKKIIGNRMVNYVDQGFWNMKPRQALPKVFIRNGCIYFIKVKTLLKNHSLIGNYCYALEMKKNESINIDNMNDLKLANIINNED